MARAYSPAPSPTPQIWLTQASESSLIAQDRIPQHGDHYKPRSSSGFNGLRMHISCDDDLLATSRYSAHQLGASQRCGCWPCCGCAIWQDLYLAGSCMSTDMMAIITESEIASSCSRETVRWISYLYLFPNAWRATNATLPCDACTAGISVGLRDFGLDFVCRPQGGYARLWDSHCRFGDYVATASFEGYAALIRSV
jgi:hypothetical protein